VPSKKAKGGKIPCPKCGGSGRGYATKKTGRAGVK